MNQYIILISMVTSGIRALTTLLSDKIKNRILRLHAQEYPITEILNYVNSLEEIKKAQIEIKYYPLWSWIKRNEGRTFLSTIKAAENLTKTLDKSNNVARLMEVLDEWLESYVTEGKRLTLKETIQAKLKILEIQSKLVSEDKKEEENQIVKGFMMRVQEEFGAPTITKEVEFDANGNPTKAKITQKLKEGSKEDLKEEPKDEIKEEPLTEEVPSNGQS